MIGDGALGRAAGPRSEPRDVELVRRMATGDLDAHRVLYVRHAVRVLDYLIGRLGGDRGLAEEVLHDVMMEAWRSAPGFRAESTARSWLLGIAHNRACNALRARRRETLHSEPDHAVQRSNGAGGRGGANAVDIAIDLGAALAALPDGQRAALELVLLHGLSVGESAAVLGVAPGTVKSRVFRAKRRLRRQLDREATK